MVLFTRILFFPLCLVSLLRPSLAERRKPVLLEKEQVAPHTLSSGWYGTIHGSGSLDFAKLSYDFVRSHKGTFTAVILKIPNKQEFVRLQKWQTDDMASSRTRRDEYLVEQGLGAMGTDGVYYGCCTPKALSVGACDDKWNNSWWSDLDDDDSMLNLTETGNVILSPKVYFQTLSINASSMPEGSDLGMDGVTWFDETTLAALMFGNCNSTESLRINGTIVWTSYLSVSTLPLYLFLMMCHGGLCLWYRECMNRNKDSRIQVEDWIFFTLYLAAVAMFLKTVYYVTEAFADQEWVNLSFACEFSESITRSVSRCLYLILAMGVGVTTPSLQNTKIAVLIGLFLGVYIYCDLATDLAALYGIVLPFMDSCFSLLTILPLIFMFWIPLALCNTMRFLEFHNETHKLQRYHWIGRIYLLAIGLGLLEFIFFVLDFSLNAGRDFSFMTQDELEEITYMIILICMSCLWKPNPSQQMYSYKLLEDDDDMMRTNMSLELSPTAIGQADHDLQLT